MLIKNDHNPILQKASVNLQVMKKQLTLFILACLAVVVGAHAQTPVPHASAEVRQKARDRADFSTLRRKIGELKEFAEERKKIPALKKDNKEIVKVYATVDSSETDDSVRAKTLIGYITQQVGDNVANAYEVTFDRASKRITAVKKTGEAIEPETPEVKEKPATKKAETAKPASKKKKDGDEDDDAEGDEKEEKPSKEKDE